MAVRDAQECTYFSCVHQDTSLENGMLALESAPRSLSPSHQESLESAAGDGSQPSPSDTQRQTGADWSIPSGRRKVTLSLWTCNTIPLNGILS